MKWINCERDKNDSTQYFCLKSIKFILNVKILVIPALKKAILCGRLLSWWCEHQKNRNRAFEWSEWVRERETKWEGGRSAWNIWAMTLSSRRTHPYSAVHIIFAHNVHVCTVNVSRNWVEIFANGLKWNKNEFYKKKKKKNEWKKTKRKCFSMKMAPHIKYYIVCVCLCV